LGLKNVPDNPKSEKIASTGVGTILTTSLLEKQPVKKFKNLQNLRILQL